MLRIILAGGIFAAVILNTHPAKPHLAYASDFSVKPNQTVSKPVEPPKAPEPPQTPVTQPQAEIKPNPPAVQGVEQWRGLVASYFGSETDYALRIIKCESGGRSNARGYNTNGSVDSGLFQVNSVHATKVGGNIDALFDPELNVRIAYQIRSGSGWSAWSCSRKI